MGYFEGVMWRLGTIVSHIHGFSTDTIAHIFLREPQHVTDTGNLAELRGTIHCVFSSFDCSGSIYRAGSCSSAAPRAPTVFMV